MPFLATIKLPRGAEKKSSDVDSVVMRNQPNLPLLHVRKNCKRLYWTMRNQEDGICHGSIQSTLWRSVSAGWMGLGIGMVGVDLHVVRHLLSSPGDGRGWSAPRRMRHGDRLEGRPFPRLDFLGFIQYQSLLLIDPQHLPFFLLSFLHRSSRSIGGNCCCSYIGGDAATAPPRLPPGDCSPNLWRPLCCLLIDHWARGGGERGPWSRGVPDGQRPLLPFLSARQPWLFRQPSARSPRSTSWGTSAQPWGFAPWRARRPTTMGIL